ncbi:hypothetical protein BDV19DRAFT_360886 [Aspergillus venezuelensis]
MSPTDCVFYRRIEICAACPPSRKILRSASRPNLAAGRSGPLAIGMMLNAVLVSVQLAVALYRGWACCRCIVCLTVGSIVPA